MQHLQIERRPGKISISGDNIQTNKAGAIALLKKALAAIKNGQQIESHKNETVVKT